LEADEENMLEREEGGVLGCEDENNFEVSEGGDE
jgi:hypothetical protein